MIDPMTHHVRQIIPAAEGWRALYAWRHRDDGTVLTSESPLVCWALVERVPAPYDDGPSVIGLALSDGNTCTYLAEAEEGFVCYLAPGVSATEHTDDAECTANEVERLRLERSRTKSQ